MYDYTILYYFETNVSVKKCIDVLTITYVPISRKLYSGTVQIHWSKIIGADRLLWNTHLEFFPIETKV